MSDRTPQDADRTHVLHADRRTDVPAPDVTPSEARQGVKGHNVRYVLTVGTIGVIVLFAIAYFAFFAT